MENRPWSVRQAVSPQGKNQEALWKLTRPSGKLGWVRDPAQGGACPRIPVLFFHTRECFSFSSTVWNPNRFKMIWVTEQTILKMSIPRRLKGSSHSYIIVIWLNAYKYAHLTILQKPTTAKQTCSPTKSPVSLGLFILSHSILPFPTRKLVEEVCNAAWAEKLNNMVLFLLQAQILRLGLNPHFLPSTPSFMPFLLFEEGLTISTCWWSFYLSMAFRTMTVRNLPLWHPSTFCFDCSPIKFSFV